MFLAKMSIRPKIRQKKPVFTACAVAFSSVSDCICTKLINNCVETTQ